MKKIHHYFALLLIFFSVTAAMGQDHLTVPKRTPQEQAAFEQTVPVNPAKIAEGQLVDPKMDPSQAIEPPVRWKADEAPVVAGKSPLDITEESRPVRTGLPPAGAARQPEAVKTQGDPFPYRDIKGSTDQPKADATGDPFPYRDVKGSPAQPDPRHAPK